MMQFLYLLSIILIISTIITTQLKMPYGYDWNYRHVKWVQSYLKLDFSPLKIYMPFFHFLMLPAVYFFSSSVKYIQIIFSGTVFISIFYMVKEIENFNVAVLTGTFLVSSPAFIQFSLMLSPSAIDFIVFPLLIVCLFKNKFKTSSALMIVLFLNHFLGIIYFSIILIYSYFYKRNFLKYLLSTLIIGIPITLFYSVPVLTALLNNPVIDINSLDINFIYPIQNIILYLGTLNCLALPFLFYAMYKFRRYHRKQLLYAVWIIAFLPLFFIAMFRWVSLFIIPFSIFEASIISGFYDI
jgi:hypothetical protein